MLSNTLPKWAKGVTMSIAHYSGIDPNVLWGVVQNPEHVGVDSTILEPEFRQIVQMVADDLRESAKAGTSKIDFGVEPNAVLGKQQVIDFQANPTDSVLQGITGDGAVQSPHANFWSVLTQFTDRPILIPLYALLVYITFVVVTKAVNRGGQSLGVGDIGSQAAKQTVANVKAGAQLIHKGIKKL
jgi:hypothetical protein